jgi:hypothetical protein
VGFSLEGLELTSGQCLQNGGLAIVRLTSGGEGSYFSKLDSSFCQIGPHDFFEETYPGLVSKLRFSPIGRLPVGYLKQKKRRSIVAYRADSGPPLIFYRK